jgi:hypothetical protein
MKDWIAPAVVVAVMLGLLTLWHRSRQAKLGADRDVLDRILADADEFFAMVNRLEAVVTSTTVAVSVAAVKDAASTLLDAWKALESAAWRVGRLSSYRYDGLRPLARRIHDACTSTARSRAFLEALATGTATTGAAKLSGALPWPDLMRDAKVYRTLAVVYRREGPLTPLQRNWWRRRGKRESTHLEIGAPLRGRKRKALEKDQVTSIEQAVALVRDLPEFEHLIDAEVNAVAYRALHE